MVCPECHTDVLIPLRTSTVGKVEYCRHCKEYFLRLENDVSRITKTIAIEEYGASQRGQLPLAVNLLAYIAYTAFFFGIAAYLYSKFSFIGLLVPVVSYFWSAYEFSRDGGDRLYTKIMNKLP